MNGSQKSGLIYLYFLPAVVVAIGFGIGHVSPLVYLPLWAVNVCIVAMAVRQLIKRTSNDAKVSLVGWTDAAILLIIPWVLFSVFAGMGPPPSTMKGWLANSTEQQVRYTILVFGGISALMGFALLKVKLQSQGERTYSILGFTVLGVAIPLFILNMIFWGYFLPNAFRVIVALPVGKRPDWYQPLTMFFYVIAVIEVALIYFATILFAIALKKANILSTRASYWYIIIAAIGIALVVLPPSVPQPFSTVGFLSAIPAISFIMPYLMGIRLLRLNRT